MALDYAFLMARSLERSANTLLQVRQKLLPDLARVADRMLATLRNGNRILICGNGGSASDAQHFAAELINRFEVERMALPALALTTDTSTLTSIANDSSYEEVFSRQIQAFAQPGDLLMALSTSGNSANVLAAVREAQQRGMWVLAMTGGSGGQLAASLRADQDMELRVPATATAPIQESHIAILHSLCQVVDASYQND